MSIEQNILARKAAEQLADLAADEAAVHGPAVWEHLLQIARNHAPLPNESPATPEPMTADEAKRFGRQPMPYGEFAGIAIDNVPLDRLLWYAEQTFGSGLPDRTRPTVDELRRYLRSKRIQADQPDEDEQDAASMTPAD